jgi:hypothetical protein
MSNIGNFCVRVYDFTCHFMTGAYTQITDEPAANHLGVVSP